MKWKPINKTLHYKEETKIFLGDIRHVTLILVARALGTHNNDVSISEVSVVLPEMSSLEFIDHMCLKKAMSVPNTKS